MFNKKKIKNYFYQIERNIEVEIDNFSEKRLVTLNFDETIETIHNRYLINEVTLNKKETTTFITSKLVSGRQFPSRIMSQPAKIYNIDIANYRVPFSGDYELLKCIPTNYTNSIMNAELSKKSIIFELTNWGEISRDEKTIDNFKNIFLENISHLEKALTALKDDTNKFSSTLKFKIKLYLEMKIKNAKLKFDSNDKLNPFK